MLVVLCVCCLFFFFFFQAEDGIRDYDVTGVQTCALPISSFRRPEVMGHWFRRNWLDGCNRFGEVLAVRTKDSAIEKSRIRSWRKFTSPLFRLKAQVTIVRGSSKSPSRVFSPRRVHFGRRFTKCPSPPRIGIVRSEEHTSELQSRRNLVCRLLLEKKKSPPPTPPLPPPPP